MKDAKAFLAKLRARGCVIKLSNSNHIKVYFKGRMVASTGSTPSDFRSLTKFRCDIRRRVPELEI